LSANYVPGHAGLAFPRMCTQHEARAEVLVRAYHLLLMVVSGFMCSEGFHGEGSMVEGLEARLQGSVVSSRLEPESSDRSVEAL